MKRTARFGNISRESEGILQFQSRQKGQRFRSEYGKSYAKSYGETRSYAEIAAGIGNPKAVRAVGQAIIEIRFDPCSMPPCDP